MRIFHTYASRLHAADAPGAVAKQEDVPGEALNGEIFVDGADEGFGGFLNDVVIGGIGDGPTTGDSRQSRPTPGMDTGLHAIPVDQGSAAPTSSAHPFGQDVQDSLKILAA